MAVWLNTFWQDVTIAARQLVLVAAPSVVEGDDSSRKLAAGLDRLELGLGDVVAKEEPRAKRADTVATREQIDVSNVIRLENNERGRRTRVEPLPHLGRVSGRSKGIQNECLYSQ